MLEVAARVRVLSLLSSFSLTCFVGCVSAPSDAQALNGGESVIQPSDSGLVDSTVTLEAPRPTRGQNSFLVELRRRREQRR